MSYKLEDLMPKRYPENRPTVLYADYWTDGDKVWSKDFMNPYPKEFVPSTTWFIDIPGAPKEVRPRKYPNEEPEKEAFYLCHNKNTDEWTPYRWDNKIGGYWMFEGEDRFYTVGYGVVDYFLPYPLEEEMEELDPYNKIKSIKIQYLDTATVFSGYDSNEEFIRDVAAAYGYNITKRAPEIAPCPFCGNQIIFEDFDWNTEHSNTDYQMVCKGCGISGPKQASVEEAIDGWNEIAGKGK